MSFGLSGAAIGGIALGAATLGSAFAGQKAAKSASKAQIQASEAGIEEERRQFDAIQKLLAPYIQAGEQAIPEFAPFQRAGQKAFLEQQAIAGLRGEREQQRAISRIESDPLYQALVQQGEQALLQQASATGGLRGGNIQAALAQFRPQMLNALIEQQYGRLGGFSTTGLNVSEALYRGGQASATGQASYAQNLGANVSNLLGQQGAARAGAALAQGEAFQAIPKAISRGFGLYSGLGGEF